MHRELTIYSPYFRSDNGATNYSLYGVKDFVFPPFCRFVCKNQNFTVPTLHILLPQMVKLIAKNLPCTKPLEIVHMITPDSEPTPLPFRLMLLPEIRTEK